MTVTTQAAEGFTHVACPCCIAAGSKVWVDEGRGTQYRACRECGTIFASPRSPREKRVAAFHSNWGTSTALRVAKMRHVGLREIAVTLQAKKRVGRLLDCGCSSGALFQSFDKDQWECHGVELSPTAAAYAAESTGAVIHAGTLRSAQLPSDHFDMVTIIDTFYYFDDPLEQLEEAARVMKGDGILGIEIPGGMYSKARSRGPLCLLLNCRWYRLASDSVYLFIYSAKGFQRLVEKAGFALVGFKAIPSPQTSRLADLVSSAHYALMRKLLPHLPMLVDWSPKVLWVFRKKEQTTVV